MPHMASTNSRPHGLPASRASPRAHHVVGLDGHFHMVQDLAALGDVENAVVLPTMTECLMQEGVLDLGRTQVTGVCMPFLKFEPRGQPPWKNP